MRPPGMCYDLHVFPSISMHVLAMIQTVPPSRWLLAP